MAYASYKSSLYAALKSVADNISDYSANPGHDFTRKGKFSPQVLMSFLINQGSGSTKNELMDFFGFKPDTPTASAFIQSRAKIKEEAFEYVFKATVPRIDDSKELSILAADGSTFSFASSPKYAPDEYFQDEGHSKKGFYSVHVNAFYDVERRIYRSALLQPLHSKDEFSAFCSMVDSFQDARPYSILFTADRGYSSYNTIAHCIKKEQYFLIRAKDITGKGISQNFRYPDTDCFDVTVSVSIVRSRDKSVRANYPYVRYVGKESTFDYLEYGSLSSFDMSFRIVRIEIGDGSYECLFTNLPADKFSVEDIKNLYAKRWKIEDSFRKLKYTIGTTSFHSLKAAFVRQEIWARLILYNFTEMMVSETAVEKNKKGGGKYDLAVNFSKSAHICRCYLCVNPSVSPENIGALLQKELVPIRSDRRFERLKTAHFRRPKYFTYRAS